MSECIIVLWRVNSYSIYYRLRLMEPLFYGSYSGCSMPWCFSPERLTTAGAAGPSRKVSQHMAQECSLPTAKHTGPGVRISTPTQQHLDLGLLYCLFDLN